VKPETAPAKKLVKSKKIVRFGTRVVAVVGLLGVVFWVGLSMGSGTWLLPNSASEVNKNLSEDLNYAEVELLYDTLRQSYDGTLDQTKLVDGLKRGLVEASGDPYTEYFNDKEAEKLSEQLTGIFSGIGAELGKDADGNIIIVSPIKGFPAEDAGLKSQDIIISVDGESTAGMSIEKAISKIRGEKGTDVILKIFRGGEETKEFTITRDTIKIPSVEFKILENNIGYIQITQFQSDTASLVQKAAAEFKDKEVKGVVLDLRGNPGGLLNSAVDVSSIWLSRNKTVLAQKRDGKVERTYKSTGNSLLLGIPTVVLIDEGSASASEIVAGALRDNNVAHLVGQKSYGKGSVQDILPLSAGGELKVTIARWYRPNGQNIDKKGITPDTVVEISEDDAKAKKDTQLDAAIEEIQKN
jgi:carboxyl-terminal processing protease